MNRSLAKMRVELLVLVALSLTVRATAQAGPAATPDPGPAVNAAVGTPIPAAATAPATTAAPLPGAAQPQSTPTGNTPPAAAVPNAAANPSTTAPNPSPQMTHSPGTTHNVTPVISPANNGGLLQIQGLNGESVPWSIIVLLTLLTLIPSILLCVTPFARLLIVFHFLRQALGLQTTPSNQTLIGLSLILTFFLMQPVGAQIYESAIIPMQAGQINAMQALSRSEGPMRKFMSHYVREKDVALFVDLAKEPRPATINDVSMRVLLPAYILSELKAGFQIGTVLFLPFLIVDMVVASITTSVGMLQLPPVVISTPLKLLLFLMVDGWHLLVGSLMKGFS